MRKRLNLLLLCLLAVCFPNNLFAGADDLSKWIPEDSSGKLKMTSKDGVMDIVSPDGLTLWYDEKLTGDYEISYSIQVVMENGKYDRLSDMNCFWGAKDPQNLDDIHARAKWRHGVFKNYNTMNLFYVGQGGNENGTTRFRQYHGEYYGVDAAKIKPVLGEYKDAAHLLKPNHWFNITIRASKGTTSYSCDGVEYFKKEVKEGETDGYFAIRLWINHVRVTDFKIRKAEQEFAFSNFRRYYREGRACNDPAKLKAISKLRADFSEKCSRRPKGEPKLSVKEMLALLNEDGTFQDFDVQEKKYLSDGTYNRGFATTPTDKVGILIGDALNRIYYIGESYKKGKLSFEEAFSDKVKRAVIHYGNLEITRSNKISRFHASCFAIPVAASNIYFNYLEQMDEVEKNPVPSLAKDMCDMLKVLGLQAYTQPLRNDDTDNNVVSVERFRNHVWWVGGNALAYRPLLQVAAMYSSIPMIDLLAEVCKKGISMTSHATYHDSFWIEGFTADGAGWGHGKQCLIWGYPIHGTSSALSMLATLKGTPWAQKLAPENVEALMNFLRGGNWYYYKGYRLPGLDRGSHVYNPKEKHIAYHQMITMLLEDWSSSFSAAQLKELKQLRAEASKNRISMKGYDNGVYNGIRWFFNNDDLIKKNDDCHVTINMASYRCDGLESANFADEYNFCPTDGMTLFQRNGDEYFRIMGGWDALAMPGTTAREGMDKLTPVTNWRGYCSKSNFAVGATDNADNAVAGYIFEKMNSSEKKGVNDKGSASKQNAVLYGFKAYKGYFILGDYMVALGAGVTNMRPELEGNLHTTIEQTALVNPVYLLNKKKQTAVDEGTMNLDVTKNKQTWIVQKDKFAYRALPEYSKNLHIALETKPAQWTKMNASNKKIKNLPKKVSILRIWQDHGRKVQNDTYGYVVYTGNNQPEAKLPFQVLRNDTLVQAVRSNDKKVVEAVFYSENETLQAKGVGLSVSAPCAVMVQDKGKEYAVSVNDALLVNNLKSIEVVLNGKSIQVELPQGLHSGKGTTIFVEK